MFSITIDNIKFSSSFFGGGPVEEEEKIIKGDDVVVELDATLEDLYMGGSLKVWREKNILKPAPGKRRCNCRNEVYHKQIGPGMFQQMTEQVCEQCPNVKYGREGYFVTVDIEKGMQDGQVPRVYIPARISKQRKGGSAVGTTKSSRSNTAEEVIHVEFYPTESNSPTRNRMWIFSLLFYDPTWWIFGESLMLEREDSGMEVVFYEDGEPIIDGVAGDLRFRIHTAPHDRFSREGNDLHTTVTITLGHDVLKLMVCPLVANVAISVIMSTKLFCFANEQPYELFATEKDWDNIKFGVDNKVDFYAVFFVKDAAVVHELKKHSFLSHIFTSLLFIFL
ncbi:hypothetical protein U1Q18_019006 [Sarracenia purpurea var. burkii]